MPYEIGDIVDSHFNVGIVAASCFASLSGCLLAVELLNRRATGLYNWRSWLEGLVCAVFLGAIGIWCMHFIGNRAIILGDGKASIQLVYSPGYSTLSAFLPIIGLSMAFAVAEYPTRSSIAHGIALTCTGIFAGLSIVGMHYIGNLGIFNYHLQYDTGYLAASVIIAIADCISVLVLFYTWKEKWISDWKLRLACAFFLAGGISAMHFTASTGCTYTLKHWSSQAEIHSRNVQVMIAGILCGVAASGTLGALFFTRHRAHKLKQRSQKVMLASAMFHPDGRLLVTNEGILPAREITDKFNPGSFADDFDIGHPVFHWLYRVSRNWAAVIEFIPHMKVHTHSLKGSHDEESRPNSSGSSAEYDPATYSDYSVIFRERFCVATAALASSLSVSIKQIGVLYEKIVETGTLKPEDRSARRSVLNLGRDHHDIERAIQTNLFGKGQLLFLTRILTQEEADRLINAGLKFASSVQVGRIIADTMQIPQITLEQHVSELKRFADNSAFLDKRGTYMSFFALIPVINGKFDVAVKKDNQDQLLNVDFTPSHQLRQWQKTFLERMNNKTPIECIIFLENHDNKDSGRTQQEQDFARVTLHALLRLAQEVPEKWFQKALFHATPHYAHLSHGTPSRSLDTTLYSFTHMVNLHESSVDPRSNVARIPYLFYNARQKASEVSTNYYELFHEVHNEFAPVLFGGKIPKTNRATISTAPKLITKREFKPPTRHDSTVHNGSENSGNSTGSIELTDNPIHTATPQTDTISVAERVNPSGRILVNSDITIQSDDKDKVTVKAEEVGQPYAADVEVSRVEPEKTFAEELFAITYDRSKR